MGMTIVPWSIGSDPPRWRGRAKLDSTFPGKIRSHLQIEFGSDRIGSLNEIISFHFSHSTRLMKTLLRTTDVCCSKQSCPKSKRPGSNKSDTDYAQRDKLLTYFPIQVWIELSQLIWVAITNHALDVKVLSPISRLSEAHRILGWCTCWSSASTYFCFLLPIAAIQNAEKGRREDFG